MGIEIAKDGAGVARDCWEFSGNECGWKKNVFMEKFGRTEKNHANKKQYADENTNIVTITVPYMVVTRSFR